MVETTNKESKTRRMCISLEYQTRHLLLCLLSLLFCGSPYSFIIKTPIQSKVGFKIKCKHSHRSTPFMKRVFRNDDDLTRKSYIPTSKLRSPTQSDIHSIIHGYLLNNQSDSDNNSNKIMTDDMPQRNKSPSNASKTTMGILGEKSVTESSSAASRTKYPPIQDDEIVQPQVPYPGTVLLPKSYIPYYDDFGPSSSSLSSPLSIEEKILIRTATPLDDLQIADLRLSVFSDKQSFETLYNNAMKLSLSTTSSRTTGTKSSKETATLFRIRSCEALNYRRLKGATCIVASGKKPKTIGLIVGSVECSTHEFIGTVLGRRRPKGSILYVTEVAVDPDARRHGIGNLLMKGVDELATLRKVESIYLHVDVTNTAAITLYKNAGYRILNNSKSGDPMYLQFTTSLNLHDGATKGRNHFLMCKHLSKEQTWLPDSSISMDSLPPAYKWLKQRKQERNGTLGFKI